MSDAGAILMRPVLDVQKRQMFAISNQRDKQYGKVYNKLRNAAAEVFCGRTSVPYCAGFGPAWPARSANRCLDQIMNDIADVKISDDLNCALDGFHVLRDGASKHLSDNSYAERLAVAVGLPDGAGILNFLFGSRSMLNGRPSLPQNFGKLLHAVSEQQARFFLIAIACCGVYQGHFGWHRLLAALVEGAWSWLRRYPKAYAKAIYVIMVSICCAVELGCVNAAVLPLLEGLAACLVGRSDLPGGGRCRFRVEPRLSDPRVLIQAVPVSHSLLTAIRTLECWN